jgi:hypothetical protein
MKSIALFLALFAPTAALAFPQIDRADRIKTLADEITAQWSTDEYIPSQTALVLDGCLITQIDVSENVTLNPNAQPSFTAFVTTSDLSDATIAAEPFGPPVPATATPITDEFTKFMFFAASGNVTVTAYEDVPETPQLTDILEMPVGYSETQDHWMYVNRLDPDSARLADLAFALLSYKYDYCTPAG